MKIILRRQKRCLLYLILAHEPQVDAVEAVQEAITTTQLLGVQRASTSQRRYQYDVHSERLTPGLD